MASMTGSKPPSKSGKTLKNNTKYAVVEENGIIKDINIASDSLEPKSIEAAIELLKGANIKENPSSENQIVNDIISLIY